MSTFAKDHLDIPLTDTSQLVAFLAAGAKPRAQWRVGVEFEKLVIDSASGEAAAHSRIARLLDRLAAAGNWERVLEDGRVIALKGPSSSVTLDPGGQLELPGRLCTDLFCSHGDFTGDVREVGNGLPCAEKLVPVCTERNAHGSLHIRGSRGYWTTVYRLRLGRNRAWWDGTWARRLQGLCSGKGIGHHQESAIQVDLIFSHCGQKSRM